MSRLGLMLAVVVGMGGVGPAAARDLDDELDRVFRGTWATLATEVYSSCAGTYSNNTIGPAGVISKADRRFEAGELVKIDKIKVKRSRVDLLTTLAIPILVARSDGPFTLYDVHECKAQLIFEMPRRSIKSGDRDAVIAAIDRVLTTHPSRTAAESSGDWNRRQRRPFPDDYEETLAEYERWKAEQTNLTVAAAIEDAVEQAADAADDMESDDDYLAGFAAGAERLHDLGFSSCDAMLDATFTSFSDRPSFDRSSAWKRGFEDGQRLVFHVRLARDLRTCFVPFPPGFGR